jgi:hypothetical protein
MTSAVTPSELICAAWRTVVRRRLLKQQEPGHIDAGEHEDGQQSGLDAHGCSLEPEAADDVRRDRQYPDQDIKGDSRYVGGQAELARRGAAQCDQRNRPADRGDGERCPPQRGAFRVDQGQHTHQSGQREMHGHSVDPPSVDKTSSPLSVTCLHDNEPEPQQCETHGREGDVEVLQHAVLLVRVSQSPGALRLRRGLLVTLIQKLAGRPR